MLEGQWQEAETVHAPAKALHEDVAPRLVEA
jgi:hypothetical protein